MTTAGLDLRKLDFFPRPTPLPGSLSDWLEIFAAPLLEPFTPGEREEIGGEVEELAAPFLRDDEGAWTADYVRLRFVAVRRASRRGGSFIGVTVDVERTRRLYGRPKLSGTYPPSR